MQAQPLPSPPPPHSCPALPCPAPPHPAVPGATVGAQAYVAPGTAVPPGAVVRPCTATNNPTADPEGGPAALAAEQIRTGGRAAVDEPCIAVMEG